MNDPLNDLLISILHESDWPVDSNLFYNFDAGGHTFKNKVTCWTPYHSIAQRLSGQPQIALITDLDDAPPALDLAVIRMGKQIPETQFWIAHAIQRLKHGGRLYIAGYNEEGAARLSKWMQALKLTPESLSKHKGRIVQTYIKGMPDSLILDRWLAPGQPHISGETGFTSCAGIFGWQKIDPGSALLAPYFSGNLKGIGADLGCGYGFLSHAALQTNPDIQTLYGYELDNRAIACARINLSAHDPRVTLKWADVTHHQAIEKSMDFIIMNPPFHSGKSHDPDLGRAFFRTASIGLKPGGQLYAVANRHLPYEKTLQDLGFETRILFEEKGFKGFHCLKI